MSTSGKDGSVRNGLMSVPPDVDRGPRDDAGSRRSGKVSRRESPVCALANAPHFFTPHADRSAQGAHVLPHATLRTDGLRHPGIPGCLAGEAGLKKLLKRFSFPGGISSHVVLTMPSSIHEDRELGYSLSPAFGATFGNTGLIVACVVGDGEPIRSPPLGGRPRCSIQRPSAAAWPMPPSQQLQDRQFDSAWAYRTRGARSVFHAHGEGRRLRTPECGYAAKRVFPIRW
jgi:hypothetical protein